MFNIINGENYSIEDIKEHQNTSGSVLRSAHVGNFNAPTLFLAQEGIPIILHEHIRGNGKIYRPGFIHVHGQEIQIADDTELPLTHLSIRNDVRGKIFEIMGRNFVTPAQMHYLSLRKLYSDNFQLASELLLEQGQFIEKAIEVLAREYPFLFANYVSRKGRVFNLKRSERNLQIYTDGDDEMSITMAEIHALAYQYLNKTRRKIQDSSEEDMEGLVMKSNLYILLTTLSEIYKGRKGEDRFDQESVDVMHFSGAEMTNYMIENDAQATKNARDINEMYETLKTFFREILPRVINFILIPTQAMNKLVTDNEEVAKKYDRLLRKNTQRKSISEKMTDSKYFSCDKIRQRIAAMNDEEMIELTHQIFAEISLLPGRVKKKISNAIKMLVDLAKNRQKIQGILVSAEIARQNLFANDEELLAAEEKIDGVKSEIATFAREIRSSAITQISQYDILAGRKCIFFPQSARSLSQRELRNILNYSFKI